MGDLVEIYLILQPRHFAVPGKTVASGIGNAIDTCIKEIVIEIGGVPSSRYAPNDYLLHGVFHEIKSTEGTWLSVPNSEVEFADDTVASGGDVIYDIVLQISKHRAKFLGYVRFSVIRHLLESSQFTTSRKQEDGSFADEKSWRVPLAKVMPLLNFDLTIGH